jgi:hypothetical protein
MNNRRHFIVRYLQGDLTQEARVKLFIKNKINALTADELRNLFIEARQEYSSAEPGKSLLTFGIAELFKLYTSNGRIPTNINDDNIRETIMDFLLAPGKKDRASLKYRFVEELVLGIYIDEYIYYIYKAKSDLQASNLIDLVLEEVGFKPEPAVVNMPESGFTFSL